MADTERPSPVPDARPDPIILHAYVEAPEAVDAESAFTATVRLTAEPLTDLRGERFDVRDGDDVIVAGVPLTIVDEDGVHASEPFELTAPAALGTHTWVVAFEPSDPDAPPYEATTVPFDVEVEAHELRAQAWGAPSAIPAGRPFEMKVGLQCSSTCDLAGQGFDIVDQDGATVATGTLGEQTWKRTKALYYANVSLTAPEAEGYAEWHVRTHSPDLPLPHAEGSATFGLNVVPAPQHTVRVTAVDRDKDEPIEGLHVWMHPFRAVTDEHGVAEVAVPEGTYRLYVSGLRYFPHDVQVEITEDLDTTVELTWEKRPEKIR